MAEDFSNALLAENQVDQENQEQHTTTDAHHADQPSSEAGHDAHAEEAGHSEESGDVFSELLSGLGDHYGMIIGPYHVMDLPLILIDDGLHVYPTIKSMEADGIFTMVHHKPVRTSDHEPPAWDLSITNLVFFQWLAIFILAILIFKAKGRFKKRPGKAPSGIQNLVESMIVFVRDDMVRPNLPSNRVADRLLPYFLSLFFFILVMNLIGLVPGGHNATGTIGTTLGLALTAFFMIQFTAIRESGIGAWFKHLLGGAPWWLGLIMVPIEVVGMFVKPFALTIRLFANMSAGHIVLLALLGILFYFGSVFVAVPIVGFSVFMYFLELLVAFIQAYVFTVLTAIFVGLAIGDHAHEEHVEHQH